MKRLTVNEIALLMYGNANTPVSEQFVKLVRDVEDCHRSPAPRELSDEEIVNLYKETEADNGGIREFARAILKKASEK